MCYCDILEFKQWAFLTSNHQNLHFMKQQKFILIHFLIIIIGMQLQELCPCSRKHIKAPFISATMIF